MPIPFSRAVPRPRGLSRWAARGWTLFGAGRGPAAPCGCEHDCGLVLYRTLGICPKDAAESAVDPPDPGEHCGVAQTPPATQATALAKKVNQTYTAGAGASAGSCGTDRPSLSPTPLARGAVCRTHRHPKRSLLSVGLWDIHSSYWRWHIPVFSQEFAQVFC